MAFDRNTFDGGFGSDNPFIMRRPGQNTTTPPTGAGGTPAAPVQDPPGALPPFNWQPPTAPHLPMPQFPGAPQTQGDLPPMPPPGLIQQLLGMLFPGGGGQPGGAHPPFGNGNTGIGPVRPPWAGGVVGAPEGPATTPGGMAQGGLNPFSAFTGMLENGFNPFTGMGGMENMMGFPGEGYSPLEGYVPPAMQGVAPNGYGGQGGGGFTGNPFLGQIGGLRQVL